MSFVSLLKGGCVQPWSVERKPHHLPAAGALSLARTRLPAALVRRRADPELDRRSFIVRDANGQALSYVYFEEEPGRRTAALLTKDEARRMGVNFAQVPGLPLPAT
jgi:hypothetical protein